MIELPHEDWCAYLSHGDCCGKPCDCHHEQCSLLRDGRTCDHRDDGYAMTAKPSTAPWVLAETRKERDEAQVRVAELEETLGRIYVLTGEDTDGNQPRRLWSYAERAVAELREEFDAEGVRVAYLEADAEVNVELWNGIHDICARVGIPLVADGVTLDATMRVDRLADGFDWYRVEYAEWRDRYYDVSEMYRVQSHRLAKLEAMRQAAETWQTVPSDENFKDLTKALSGVPDDFSVELTAQYAEENDR